MAVKIESMLKTILNHLSAQLQRLETRILDEVRAEIRTSEALIRADIAELRLKKDDKIQGTISK